MSDEQYEGNVPPPPPPPPPATPFGTLLTRVSTDDLIRRAIETAAVRRGEVVADQSFTLQEVVYNPDIILATVSSAVNGDNVLTAQKVSVEYLRRDQNLMIPAPLACTRAPAAGGYGVFQAKVIERVSKLCTMSFRQLEQLASGAADSGALMITIDDLAAANPMPAAYSWDAPDFLDDMLARGLGEEYETMVFSFISLACQLNCDIRDVGFLNRTDGHLGDGDHLLVDQQPGDRLHNKLHPHSFTMLAALNYASVGNSWWGAILRAYGVGAGILPSPNSRSKKEYKFTTAHPTIELQNSFRSFLDNVHLKNSMISVCMNLIAMFGLLHLNKDHTYRTGDANMERIGKSFLQTVRTITTTEVQTQFLGQQEILVRTAQHPFGLGQTYFVAKFMYRYSMLAEPLAIRINASPPPVQRIMIARAAYNEWGSIPAGQAISVLYDKNIGVIDAEAAQILVEPSRYSALHRLYGHDAMATVSEAAKEMAEALMPVVYGFAMSQHSDSGDNKDGIALALSLKNVAANRRTLSELYQNMWSKYMESADQSGIVKFVNDALEAQRNM
jgi:hypothetical protein